MLNAANTPTSPKRVAWPVIQDTGTSLTFDRKRFSTRNALHVLRDAIREAQSGA